MHPTRIVTLDDVPALADLARVNRDFLAPWEPIRADAFYTEAGQLAAVQDDLERHRLGQGLPHVILDEHGRVAGRITLHGIIGRAFQSCGVGYWVSAQDNGRGLAKAAVHHIKHVAFGELGLHRIQAETLLHNFASQAVLRRNGFQPIGMAPKYLRIAGRWQDHLMFQVLNDKPM